MVEIYMLVWDQLVISIHIHAEIEVVSSSIPINEYYCCVLGGYGRAVYVYVCAGIDVYVRVYKYYNNSMQII